MVQRWTLNEDIIICKYCIEHHWTYTSDADIEAMMSQLEEAGGFSRSFGAIKKRAYTYEKLLERHQLPNMPRQVIRVYEILSNENAEKHQGVKSYIREIYEPNEASEYLDVGMAAESNGLLALQRVIDYKSTFPMVLQKFMDLKGIKKHNLMCRRIGMKPDTFSAILRGKYKEVKKDNVLKICVGLELRVNEAEELLESAGFMFSNGIMTDVVVKAYLWNRIYSVVAINAELYENNEKMLFKDYVIEYEEI